MVELVSIESIGIHVPVGVITKEQHVKEVRCYSIRVITVQVKTNLAEIRQF